MMHLAQLCTKVIIKFMVLAGTIWQNVVLFPPHPINGKFRIRHEFQHFKFVQKILQGEHIFLYYRKSKLRAIGCKTT